MTVSARASEHPFAVVVCTRNRPDDLRRTLQSIAEQADPAMTVIVVDSSDRVERAANRAILQAPLGARIILLPYDRRPSTSRQRNAALDAIDELAPGASIVHFLDDDVTLAKGYFDILNRHLDAEPALGGVGGRIVENGHGRSTGSVPSVARRLFLLDARQPGRVLPSGGTSPGQAFPMDQPAHVEWLGGCSAYRRSVFDVHRFESRLEGAAMDEDLDFSSRVGRERGLLVDPTAVVYHHQSPVSRSRVEHTAHDALVHRYWFLEKNIRHPLRKPAFWWSALGRTVASGSSRSEIASDVARGRRRAFRTIWTRTHPLLEPTVVGRFARFVRTAIQLKPSQVIARIGLTVRRKLRYRRGGGADARYAEAALKLRSIPFADPGLARLTALRLGRKAITVRMERSREVMDGSFELLNTRRHLGRIPDWHDRDLDVGTRLWKTLLHEFDYGIDLAAAANASGGGTFADHFFHLVESWIDACPISHPDSAKDVWNARAVATRLLNWLVAGHILHERDAAKLTILQEEIGRHAAFLRDNLETDLGANHLIRDLAALTIADRLIGVAPSALGKLEREVGDQVESDGSHFEQSPLYHCIVLQDLVEVCAFLGDAAPSWLTDAVARMTLYLERLLPPTRELPLFGDSWLGDTDPGRLLDEARLVTASRDDEAIGRVGLESYKSLIPISKGPIHVVVRTGPHGPDSQLGHAHCDGLSLECWYGGQKLVTDTGTWGYDPGPMRDLTRATAGHNTVGVDRMEQLEFWSSFRVGRRGGGRLVAANESEDVTWVWAEHDGWKRLAGEPVHHRLVTVTNEIVLVLDAVLGRGVHTISSRLNIHPDWSGPEGDADDQVRALNGYPMVYSAPLFERWGVERSLRAHEVEMDAELPWFGGWVLAPTYHQGVKTEAQFAGDKIVVGIGLGDRDLEAVWKPGSAKDVDATRIRLILHSGTT